MRENYILIGMPGAGKSTIGVVLAKVLGYNFIDLDLVISRKAKMRLQDIIETQGLNTFLRLEESAASHIKCKHTVVATGGSVVLSKKGMSNLSKIGKVIFFDVSYNELTKRIRNFESRGIACKKGDTLLDVYNQRIELYREYAEITVNCDNKTINDIIDELKDILKIN